VHELHEDLAAPGVDRIDNHLPSADVRIIEEPGDARVAQTVSDGQVPSVMIRPALAPWP